MTTRQFPDHIEAARVALESEDVDEVERLLLGRALAGEVNALELLGTAIMLFRPEQRDDAIWFLQRACDAGSGPATHNLGTLYMSGDFPDREKARAFYRQAHERGFEHAVASDPLWWKRI
jgi:TPR repeat protein